MLSSEFEFRTTKGDEPYKLSSEINDHDTIMKKIYGTIAISKLTLIIVLAILWYIGRLGKISVSFLETVH